MDKLSDAQVELIQEFVQKKMGQKNALGDELFDHLCILTELEIQAGKPFAIALETAFAGLDQHALAEIRTQEKILRYTDKRLLLSLSILIALCLAGAIWLFVSQIRGFRLFALIALVLSAYFLLPLLTLRRWYKATEPLSLLVGVWLIFIQLHSLMFIVVRPFRWRAGLFFIALTLLIALFYWAKHKKMGKD
jgi:hypothetical protein